MTKYSLISLLLPTFFLILSCDRAKQDNSKLVLRLTPAESNNSKLIPTVPASAKSVNLRPAAFSPSLSISGLAEVNCYAVFVGGPEASMRGSYCSDSTSNTEKIRFGPFAGLIPVGTEISVDVPSGPDRNIYLVGLKSQNGACKPVGTQQPDEANLSSMHIIAKKTMGLSPGAVSVDLTTVFDPADKIDDCHFQNGGGGSNGGIPTQIMITKDFFPRQGFLANQCSQFYVGAFDNGGRQATANQNMQVNISNGAGTNYAMYDNCDCSGSTSVINLPAGSQQKCVSYMSQATPGTYTFKVEPVTVPTGITANFQRQFEVQNPSYYLFDYTGPRRILPDVCYRFQFQYYLWNGSPPSSAGIGYFNSPTLANFYTSDAMCMTNTSSINGSNLGLPGTSPEVKKVDVWFKASTIGTRNLEMSYSGVTTLNFPVSVENLGNQTVARGEFWSDNNIQSVSVCSKRPLRVQLVNSYGIAVPAPAGGTTFTVNKTAGPGAINIFPDGDTTCGSTAATSFTIAAGNSHADLYYNIPTVTGSYTLTLTVNGVNTGFNLTAQ